MRLRRKQFAVRKCAADGCRVRFVPIKSDHIYHSANCASYMRMKAWREKKKKDVA